MRRMHPGNVLLRDDTDIGKADFRKFDPVTGRKRPPPVASETTFQIGRATAHDLIHRHDPGEAHVIAEPLQHFHDFQCTAFRYPEGCPGLYLSVIQKSLHFSSGDGTCRIDAKSQDKAAPDYLQCG